MLIGMAAGMSYLYARFDQPGPLEYDTVVVVPRGEGVREIAARLERENVISDRVVFVASVVLYFRVQSKLKAGEYAITKGATMREVLDTLVEGKAILHSVSVPEGMTSYQVVRRLNAQRELKGRITMVPREGSLLPDTYRYARGTTRQDLLARMQREQEMFMDKIWPKRSAGLPIRTKQEAITLASVVEKETGQVDERAKVAAVFLNRLKKGRRLESDPTIIYGLSGGKGTLGRPITKTDMRQMTPYNTYRNGGLPPTPIANPGRAALEAVLRPAKIDDMFFVANGKGGHIFAETFAQHKKNVAEWRKIEAKFRAKAAAKKAAEAKAAAEPKAAGTAGGEKPSVTTTQATVSTVTATVPAVAVSSSADTAGTTAGNANVPVPERKPRP